MAVLALGSMGLIIAQNNKGDKTMGSSASSGHNEQMQQSGSAVQETDMITYKSFSVVQKSIKVKKGTTVTWVNEDNAKHDVTPDTETADFKASDLFGKGESYSVTFNTVGKFSYFCSPHPYMKGTVEVVE